MSKMSKGQTWFNRYDDATYNREFDGMEKDKGSGPVWARNFIAKRLAENANIGYDPFCYPTIQYHPTLSPEWLKWNKNSQCPPKTWDNLQAPTNGKYDLVLKSTGYKCCIWRSENKMGQEWFNNLKNCAWNSKCSSKPQGWEYSRNKKCLVIAHHNSYSDTLKTTDYAEVYFNSVFNKLSTVCHFIINADSGERHGFWLINADNSPFVYAILKSSMFKAWCSLFANTEGVSHFAPPMWDTFPLPNLTCSQKGKIITAGWELQEGRKDSKKKLDKLVDGLFTPADSTHILSDECRIRILAQGFLDAFYGA